MTLKAIIIRADGALAEIETLRREAFAGVFAEAGFDWTCCRKEFAKTAALGGSEERMAYYVRRCLRGRRETEDFSLLIQAMHRRVWHLFSQVLETTPVEPRPGMRELVLAARSDGLRLVLVAELPRKTVEVLAGKIFGLLGREAFEFIVARAPEANANVIEECYREAIRSLGIGPHHCLAIETTQAGANAARALRLPVLTMRGAFATPLEEDDVDTIDDLPNLLGRSEHLRLEPLNDEERTALLAILKQLHVGNCKNVIDFKRSEQMRVSDILRSKGSAVMTIEPDATIRAFADKLKVAGVGAMLVTDQKGALCGIISERDLARGVADFGPNLSSMHVSDMMTQSVVSCRPEDSVASAAKIMTQRRIRHLPVVVDGLLVGLVSIGDVLKYRLDEVQLEANVLRDVALARK